MTRESGAMLNVCVIGVAVLLITVGEVNSREIDSGKSEPRQTDGPRAVVAKWIDLVLANNLHDSWLLTTKSTSLNAHDDLPRLRNRNEIRVERSLANESVAVVATNIVEDRNSERDRAFAFWLVRQDGAWRINRSYIDELTNVDEQLRGFLMGGNPRWLVTHSDIVGTWLAGPGRPGGVGSIACGSRLQFVDDERFTLEAWGPAGPDGGIEVQRGRWRIEGDRIIRAQDRERSVSRISWVGADSLVLQPADQELGDGTFGTRYHREKTAK